MRGKPALRKHIGVRNGITPAGAGKTHAAATCAISHEDHPRRCGENRGTLTIAVDVTGSPPQVRGKPHRPKERGGTPGITPAGAGKTSVGIVSDGGLEDHPRRCGENRYSHNRHYKTVGSPPQVRGKHAVTSSEVMSIRITPAGAGKTAISTPVLQSK